MGNPEKKWKGLLHKVGYLRMELEERKEKISKFESEIGDKLHEIAPDLAAPPPPPPDPEGASGVAGENEQSESEAGEGSDQEDPQDATRVDQPESHSVEAFKKLWKQIALKTHPDRNGGDPELSKAYATALEAWNNGEVETLIDVATDLNIKVQDPTPEMIEALELRASKMEEEIRKHESNMLWAWGHADHDKQSLIVDELLRYKRKKRAT